MPRPDFPRTLREFQRRFADEEACRRYLAASRWPDGFRCGRCEQCVAGEGACTVAAPAITTAWDWLSQVNAATYAGHNDWRLPSESGCNSCYTGSLAYTCTFCGAHELETILLSPYPCGTSPCIASIFGPTPSAHYWSSSTFAPVSSWAWFVFFSSGRVDYTDKLGYCYVRAVRGGS